MELKKKASSGEMMRGGFLIDSDIKLPWVDRFRILCGFRLQVRTEVRTQWKFGEFDAQNTVFIEKVFSGIWLRIKKFFRLFRREQPKTSF